MDFYIRRIVRRVFSRISFGSTCGMVLAADANVRSERDRRFHSISLGDESRQLQPKTVPRGGSGFRLAIDQISEQNNQPIKRSGIRGIRTISAVTIRWGEGGACCPACIWHPRHPTRIRVMTGERRGGPTGTILPQITSSRACGRQSARRSACRAYYRLDHTACSENKRRVPRFTRRWPSVDAELLRNRAPELGSDQQRR